MQHYAISVVVELRILSTIVINTNQTLPISIMLLVYLIAGDANHGHRISTWHLTALTSTLPLLES